MASTINASTSPAAIVQTADGTANLSLQSNGTTIAALTSTGMAVTGTLSASGVTTLSSSLSVTSSITMGTANWFSYGTDNTFYSDSSYGLIIKAPATSNFIAFRSSNDTERMRIDSSGNVFMGVTAQRYGTCRLVAEATSNQAAFLGTNYSGDVSSAAVYISKYDNNSTTSQVFVRFLFNNITSGGGQINANGASAAAFGSFSDQRLKENIVNLPSQLDNIMALRPVEFDYIESEGGGHQIGFIAQEVKDIYPDLVGEREDGMFTLTDMNKNDARLIKCIQEQQALITSLTARITALEGA